MNNTPQTPLHVFSPSQYLNFGWLILAIGLFFVHPFAGIFGLVIFGYRWLEVTCWRYEIYEDYMVEVKGVFSVTRETVNYFRIKSIMMEEPFWMRIFGMSVVSITTSEQFKTRMDFHGVELGSNIVEFLQEMAREKRKQMGIRDFDVFNT